MADNNKVTIDAAWFAELYAAKKDKDQYAKAVLNIAKERDELKAANEDLKSRVVSDTERKHFAKLEDEYIAASKERDELKAKLERANQTNSAQADQLRDALNALEQERMNKCDEVTAKRLAAAERCIEECFAHIVNPAKTPVMAYSKIEDLIRAYREKKEAAR